ncbi:hypothetical protein ACFWIB_23640 [Streptomyces sp. NPDC127051]|uniref:hypothetical protein n=1 Tax=Streptomyces sp. NPDC127051 TaxID=3347119 RepID=UPI003651977C
MAKKKPVALPKFVPFRDDSISVVMSDAPAIVARIVHYTPGKRVPRPWDQPFRAATHAGLIDPEQEAWCLLWNDGIPGSAHPDALTATAAACDQYPQWETAVYGRSPRPPYPAIRPSTSKTSRPISVPTGGQKGWMHRRPR